MDFRQAFVPALALLAGCVVTGEASIDLAADFTDGDGDPGSVVHVWTESEGDLEEDFAEFSCADRGDFKEITVGVDDASYWLTFRLDGEEPLDGLDVNFLDGAVVTNRSFDVDSDSDIQPLSELDCTITGGPPDLTMNADCGDLVAHPDYPDAWFAFVLTVSCPRWESVFE